jgi:hypothetical protein
VRYDAPRIVVTGAASIADLRTLVNDELRSSIAKLVEESGARLRALSLRPTVTGSTTLHREIEREMAKLRDDFEWRGGDASAFIDAVSVRSRPARDLDALARGDDAVALLARLALAVSSGGYDVEGAPVMDGARDAAATLLGAKQYRYIDDLRDSFEDDALRSLAAQQSLSLLDELLSQKEIA